MLNDLGRALTADSWRLIRLALAASAFDNYVQIDPRFITLIDSKFIPTDVNAANDITVRLTAMWACSLAI